MICNSSKECLLFRNLLLLIPSLFFQNIHYYFRLWWGYAGYDGDKDISNDHYNANEIITEIMESRRWWEWQCWWWLYDFSAPGKYLNWKQTSPWAKFSPELLFQAHFSGAGSELWSVFIRIVISANHPKLLNASLSLSLFYYFFFWKHNPNNNSKKKVKLQNTKNYMLIVVLQRNLFPLLFYIFVALFWTCWLCRNLIFVTSK